MSQRVEGYDPDAQVRYDPKGRNRQGIMNLTPRAGKSRPDLMEGLVAVQNGVQVPHECGLPPESRAARAEVAEHERRYQLKEGRALRCGV